MNDEFLYYDISGVKDSTESAVEEIIFVPSRATLNVQENEF